MKIIEVQDQIEGGKVAFDLFKEKLQEGAQTIGLATGSSPLEFYKQIRESDLDLSNLISVNLDEYVGLTGDDPHPTVISWRKISLMPNHLKKATSQ